MTGGLADADRPAVTRALVGLLDRTDVDHAAVIEALGRAGDAGARGALLDALGNPAVAAVAGVALGRLGRRGIALDQPLRARLIVASGSADRALRYGATYALAREAQVGAPPAAAAPSGVTTIVPPSSPVVVALRDRLRNPNPEIRITAVTGLVRHHAVARLEGPLVGGLGDLDWRGDVALEGALAGADGTASGRAAVATFVVRQWSLLAGGAMHAPDAHVVVEGLRLLDGHLDAAPVRTAVTRIAQRSGGDAVRPALALPLAWTACLASAALARADGVDPHRSDRLRRLLACGGGALDAGLRGALIAGVVGASPNPPPVRWGLLQPMLASTDARVASAAIPAAFKLWVQADALRPAILEAVVARLGDPRVAVAEAAVDAMPGFLASPSMTDDGKAAIDAGLLTAARRARDPELLVSIFGALGTARVPGGDPVCAANRAHPIAAVADAARACVTALRGADPGPTPPRGATPRPPVNPAAVLGRTITWTVDTTRGRIVIALEPDLAPWSVAAIVDLTRRHFYDGLSFHRVVPGFVIQGGDPTGTGAGGPGYTLPAEPGSRLDGATFATGAVGIADAGKDTGGSQWFVMQARAPHLEGRYTRIGHVVSGQAVVDGIEVGDRITAAAVEVR